MENQTVQMVMVAAFAVFLAVILGAYIAQTLKIRLFKKLFGFNPKNIRRENGGKYYEFEAKVIATVINQFGAAKDLVAKFLGEYANKDPVPDCAYAIFADKIQPEIGKFYMMYHLAIFFHFRPKEIWKEKILELEAKAKKIAGNPPQCVWAAKEEIFREAMAVDRNLL